MNKNNKKGIDLKGSKLVKSKSKSRFPPDCSFMDFKVLTDECANPNEASARLTQHCDSFCKVAPNKNPGERTQSAKHSLQPAQISQTSQDGAGDIWHRVGREGKKEEGQDQTKRGASCECKA